MSDRESFLNEFDSKNALRTMADRRAVGAYVDAVLTAIHLAAGAPCVELITFRQALEHQLYANESDFVRELRNFFDSESQRIKISFWDQDVVARQLASKSAAGVGGLGVSKVVAPRACAMALLEDDRSRACAVALLEDGRWRLTRTEGQVGMIGWTLPPYLFKTRRLALEFAHAWLDGADMSRCTISETGCVDSFTLHYDA